MIRRETIGEEAMSEILVSVKLEELPEGGFLATSDQLPGLVAQGRTMAETLEIAQDVARKLVESYQEHGDELPSALRGKSGALPNIRIPVSIP